MARPDGGNERRTHERLTNEEVEAIALRAKELVMAEVYAEIGKGVVSRLVWLLGLAGTALVTYLTAKGYLKFS